MGGVCLGGTSSVPDAKEGSWNEFSGFPGKQYLRKQKEVSSPRPNGNGSTKSPKKYDKVESDKLKSPSLSKKGSSKVAETSAFLGLKQAVKVLDTIGKSVPGLTKEFIYGLVPKGNTISILSFEVANTIAKGANLLQSLSENSILSLNETLRSEAVRRLVSEDMDELLRIASSDKRQEFDVFLREVIRFGDLCKDSRWHDFDRHFSKLNSGNSSLRSSRDEAETAMEDLILLAQFTYELYHELNTLDRLEQDYKQKLGEAALFDLPVDGEELVILREELKHQRKLVKVLKRKSLWSINMDEIMVKFVDTAAYIHKKIIEAFGSNGIVTSSSIQDAEEIKEPPRLGPAGLALHYANIIVQIDTIAARPACLPHNVRDSLYHSLPSGVKKALRSRLQAIGPNENIPISRVKAEMDKTSRWLVPFATNTIKAHQKFGWVGDWANAGKSSSKNTSTVANEPIRLQTLYHADKEKMDLYILELVVCLHRLISLVKQRVHSIGPSGHVPSSNHKGPNLRPGVQRFPPIDYNIPKPNPPGEVKVKHSLEDKRLSEEGTGRRSSGPGISKTEEVTVSRRNKGKVCPSSQSTGSSPEHDKTNANLDLVDAIDESDLEFS